MIVMRRLQSWRSNFMKKIAVFALSFLLIGIFLAPSLSFAEETDWAVSKSMLLPTSPLYFIKEAGRAIQVFFTFNAEKKAELKAKIAEDKLIEAKIISEKQPENKTALEKALQNYENQRNELKIRLQNLTETSKNPNISTLIQKIDEKIAIHTELFNRLINKAGNNETAGWETYSNNEYGFEFRYPDSLVLNVSNTKGWYGKKIVEFIGTSGGMYVSFDATRNDPKELQFPEEIFGKVVPKSISFGPAQSYLYSFAEGTTGQRVVAMEYKDGLLLITFVQGSYEFPGPSLNLFKDNARLMNEILATFKFIDQTSKIKIISPVAGEKWEIGKTYQIKWTGGEDKVDIFLINGGRQTQGGSVAKDWTIYGIPNTGFYDFKVPDNFFTGINFKFYISDSNSNAYSDSFSIVSSVVKLITPNGGEIIKAGSTFDIKWQTSSDLIKEIQIYLIKSKKGQKETSEWSISQLPNWPSPIKNTGFYSWAIPTQPILQSEAWLDLSDFTAEYKIGVRAYGSVPKQGLYDESDAPFSIVSSTGFSGYSVGEIRFNPLAREGEYATTIFKVPNEISVSANSANKVEFYSVPTGSSMTPDYWTLLSTDSNPLDGFSFKIFSCPLESQAPLARIGVIAYWSDGTQKDRTTSALLICE